jgi:hypothetical protein
MATRRLFILWALIGVLAGVLAFAIAPDWMKPFLKSPLDFTISMLAIFVVLHAFAGIAVPAAAGYADRFFSSPSFRSFWPCSAILSLGAEFFAIIFARMKFFGHHENIEVRSDVIFLLLLPVSAILTTFAYAFLLRLLATKSRNA